MDLSLFEERFRRNLGRVRYLLIVYDQVCGVAQGRPSVQEADILRAAVVFLHASLEDLLRNLAAWRLPFATSEVLSQIPFAGDDGRKTTLNLGDLARHRGQSVEDVISESVIAHLGRSNYNDSEDVAKLLVQIGLPQDPRKRLMDAHAARLNPIMSRRHQIVHRLDRNDSSGRGHHDALSIGKVDIERWIGVIQRFGEQLLSEVKVLPPGSETRP